MKKIKVTYVVRDKRGFLVDRVTSFHNISDAIKFLRAEDQKVGKPIIEAA